MTLRGNERGQILILITGGLVVLLCFIGLAVDAGVLYYNKRMLQTVADSAAIGGASALQHSENVTAAAQHDALLNGFTLPASAVHNPPNTGPHAGNLNYVEVRPVKSVPTYFVRILGYNFVNVTARAVAMSGSAGSSPNLIYALNKTKSKAFQLSGAGNTWNVTGGIVDDSSASSNAFYVGGAGNKLTATSIGVVGGVDTGGGAGNTVTPTPKSNSLNSTDPVTNDPFASLTAPSQPSQNGSYNATTHTYSPGYYSGGISTGGAGGSITFAPGLYYIDGGMSIGGAGMSVSGSGVTFYINTGGVSISGAGNTITFSAQTTGTYAGILFFQNNTTPDTTSAQVGGAGVNLNLTGALYFKDAALNLSGAGVNSNPNGTYTILVADTISLSGAGNLNDDFSSLPGGSPISGGSSATPVALVE